VELPKPPPARLSSSAAKKAGEWLRIAGEIRACRTHDELALWWDRNRESFDLLPAAWLDGIENAVTLHAEQLFSHSEKD
jgi:hypothetical protein